MVSSSVRHIARRSSAINRHPPVKSQRALFSQSCISQARRSVAKSNPSTPRPSPEKLRAIIAIYHHAKYFVTHENLDRTIDAAFVGRFQSYGIPTEEKTYDELFSELQERRRTPKTSEWNFTQNLGESGHVGSPAGWSKYRTEREAQVVQALYGTSSLQEPGLEMLEEEREKIEELLQRNGETKDKVENRER